MINGDKVREAVGYDNGGVALICICVDTKYMYGLIGSGEALKLSLDQLMVEDEQVRRIVLDAWKKFEELSINNN